MYFRARNNQNYKSLFVCSGWIAPLPHESNPYLQSSQAWVARTHLAHPDLDAHLQFELVVLRTRTFCELTFFSTIIQKC